MTPKPMVWLHAKHLAEHRWVLESLAESKHWARGAQEM